MKMDDYLSWYMTGFWFREMKKPESWREQEWRRYRNRMNYIVFRLRM